MERIATGEEAMLRITTLLEEIGGGIREVGERSERVSGEIDAASSRGQGMKAALALTNRLAHELEEPASLIEDRGHDYAKALSDLDPGVHAWLDLIAAQDQLDEDQLDFLQNVIEMVAASDEALGALQGLTDGAKTMATYSRSLRAPVRKMRGGLQGVLDGKAIMEEWGKRAKDIRDAADEGSEGRIHTQPE
jgi:hypothetical protein